MNDRSYLFCVGCSAFRDFEAVDNPMGVIACTSCGNLISSGKSEHLEKHLHVEPLSHSSSSLISPHETFEGVIILFTLLLAAGCLGNGDIRSAVIICVGFGSFLFALRQAGK